MQVDKQTVVCLQTGILPRIKRSRLRLHAAVWMHFKSIIAELRNPEPKHMYIYIWTFSYKVLEHVKLLYRDRKQIGGCLALGESGSAAGENEGSFGDENVVYLNFCDVYTGVEIHLIV